MAVLSNESSYKQVDCDNGLGCQQYHLRPFVNEDFCSFSTVISGNTHVWISVTFQF